MIRVIMTMMSGKKEDLLPENMPIRKVCEKFDAICEGHVVVVEGKRLEGMELDMCLREFGIDDTAHIALIPAPPKTVSCDPEQAAEDTREPEINPGPCSCESIQCAKELRAEHLRWFIEADIPAYESRRIIDLMRTGPWYLVWSEEEKCFALHRKPNDVSNITDPYDGTLIHWSDDKFDKLDTETKIARLQRVIDSHMAAFHKDLEDLNQAKVKLFEILDGQRNTEMPF